MSSAPRLSSLLLPFVLAGCATQQTATPQAPDRLDRLEQRMESADATHQRALQDARAALERLEAAQLALASRLGDLARQSAAQQDGIHDAIGFLRMETDQLDTRTNAAHASLDRLDATQRTLAERLAQNEARLGRLEATMQELAALTGREYLRQNGKEAFTVTLREDRVMYPINAPELPAGDRARLDELVDRLGPLGEEFHLEIQGHTDNIGPEDNNFELGKARAEVVKRYLHEQKKLPLSQMSVISLGSTRPLESGTSGNRRVLIRVLVPK